MPRHDYDTRYSIRAALGDVPPALPHSHSYAAAPAGYWIQLARLAEWGVENTMSRVSLAIACWSGLWASVALRRSLFDEQASQAVTHRRQGALACAIQVEQVQRVVGPVIQRHAVALPSRGAHRMARDQTPGCVQSSPSQASQKCTAAPADAGGAYIAIQTMHENDIGMPTGVLTRNFEAVAYLPWCFAPF